MTRQEYMNVPYDEEHRAKAHIEYYSQFVGRYQREVVSSAIGRDRIINSKDQHFNDIPLHEWDSLRGRLGVFPVAMQSVGDYLTLSGVVCIAKEAARQIREGAK